MQSGVYVVFAVVILLVLGFLLLQPPAPSPRPVSQQPWVAILPFNNLTPVKGLEDGLRGLLASRLEGTLRYQLVAMSRIQPVLEGAHVGSAVLTPADALGIGRAVQAHYVLLGTATAIRTINDVLVLTGDVQAIRTDQGTVVAAIRTEGRVLFKGIRITPERLQTITFYDEGKVAELIRAAAASFVDKAVKALIAAF